MSKHVADPQREDITKKTWDEATMKWTDTHAHTDALLHEVKEHGMLNTV